MTATAQRPTVLVVETNFLIASVIATPLTDHGYHVVVAMDGAEALAFLDAHAVRVALIDFRLQHGGPDGLVAALSSRNVPFIFCTAATSDEVVEVFPDAPVLAKPFSDEELLATVAGLTSVPMTAWVAPLGQ